MEASNHNLKILKDAKLMLLKYRRLQIKAGHMHDKQKSMRESIMAKLQKITPAEGALYMEDIERIISEL